MAIPFSYNLRNLRERYTTTIMTALGIGLTVAVLLGILALVNGLKGALAITGHPNQIIVMRQGSTAELVSGVQLEKFNVIKFFDEVAQIDGEPMVSHEVVSVASLPLRGGDPNETLGNVNVRGLSPIGIKMREGIELVSGRWFDPGKREMVVGEGVNAIRAGTDIGDEIPYGRGDWKVVGIFKDGRSAYNSEIWVDGNLATTDLGRGSTRSSVLVRAKDEAAALSLIDRVKNDQRVALEGKLERDYYKEQMSSGTPVETLGIFVAAIMAIGSCFAAMNTMYTAVSRWGREIGTLRLLGFSRWSVMTSFVMESVLIAVIGGIVGVLLVLPLNGLQSRIGNNLTFSETTFSFHVTPESMALGLAFATAMGLLGGLLPARMAARNTILGSLREL